MDCVRSGGREAANLYHAARDAWNETRTLIIDCGYTQADLVDLGMTPAEARTALTARADMPWHDAIVQTWHAKSDRDASPSTPLDEDYITLIPAAQTPDSLARATMNSPQSYYARDLELQGQVPHLATHLAICEGNAITHTRLIRKRFYVPCPQEAGVSRHKRLGAIIASDEYAEHWPNPADVFLLDEPIKLDHPVSLGASTIRGVSSYRRRSLNKATRLKDAKTIRQSEG